MTEQYTPFKAGRTGKEVHAGVVIGEVTWANRKFGEQVGKQYMVLCNVKNTHNINKPVMGQELAAGTPITCEKCLRMIEKRRESSKRLLNL